MVEKESICLNCIYGVQPYGYYPIECVYSAKNIKEMYYDKYQCKHFEACPEQPEPQKQEPWNIIYNLADQEL